MEAATSKVFVFWLVFTCIAAATAAVPVVPSGSAVETQDLAGCLLSFVSVKGCVEAIHDAITDKVYDGLEKECCTAVVQLSDNCWSILFPDQPYVPFVLKAVCQLIGGTNTVAPPPY